jgi:hypothetical protein
MYLLLPNAMQMDYLETRQMYAVQDGVCYLQCHQAPVVQSLDKMYPLDNQGSYILTL